MTAITSTGRIIAEQVVRSADAFGSGLTQSIANRGSGTWGSGPLWDAAILSMRTHGGSLANDLENLKLLGADVFDQLTPELRRQLDDQLAGINPVLKEIHTDKGGEFVGQLTGFETFGRNVAKELKVLLAKADEAGAESARTAVTGDELLDWSIVDDVGKQTVKVTEQAAEQVLRAGAR